MSPVKALLDESRTKLLDLTLRNTLLNYNLKRKSRLIIVDELPNVLYGHLMEGKRLKMEAVPYPEMAEASAFLEHIKKLKFSNVSHMFSLLEYAYFASVYLTGFRALEEMDKVSGLANVRSHAEKLGIALDEEAPLVDSESMIESKHADTVIQTLHYADTLEKMMQKRKRESSMFVQEKGTNLLYLAIGFLKWKQSAHTHREIYAPLILIPIEIVRGKVEKDTGVYSYTIHYTDDEMYSNVSLIYKMKQEFGIDIPVFEEGEKPEVYFAKINAICAHRPELIGVSRRFALDFFHFSKLLMYLDLESSAWPKDRSIEKNPLLTAISGDPVGHMQSADQQVTPSEETEKMGLVMDADSSQREAIAQVMHGHNLIIEGPPGTGKSQTISNLIAVALAEGKNVLFVAEKLVALEVVKRRLDSVGLGDFILELHSHKSNKANVYASLRQRINMQPRGSTGRVEDITAEQEQYKRQIQTYLNISHTRYETIGQTPFVVFGEVQNRAQESFEDLEASEAFLAIGMKDLKTIELSLDALEKILDEDKHIINSVWQGFLTTHAITLDAENILSLFEEMKRIYREFAAVAIEGLAPTQKTLEMFVNIEADGLLDNCPSPEALKTIESFDVYALKALIERSEKLRAKTEQFKEIDLAGLDKLEEIENLSRTIRRYKDIGFFGKWFNRDYKRARQHFNMLILQETINDPAQMCKVLDYHKTNIEYYMKELRHLYKDAKEILEPLGIETVESIVPGNLLFIKDGLNGLIDLKDDVLWKSKMLDAGFPLELFEHLTNEGQQEYILGLKKALVMYGELQKKLSQVIERIHRYGKLSDKIFFSNKAHMHERARILEKKLEEKASFVSWIDASRLLATIDEYQLGFVLEYAKKHDLIHNLKALFLYGYYREWAYKMLRENEILAKFNRHFFEGYLKEYRKLDKKLGSLYAQAHATTLAKAQVPEGNGGKVGEKTEMQLIRNEIHKQKRHLPIRQLLKRAPRALRALKPCFMMSPLSVAQFLDPKQEPFDLIVMDEASQIFPEDALGAIARAKQVVVVGDPNQLPPTSFFSLGLQDYEAEETPVTTAESILDLMLRVSPSVKRLKWHYRSRHESLIAFSNYHFYDSELVIFPSPINHGDIAGISRVFVENGFYKHQQNMKEAVKIVAFVAEHLLKGSKESLGVVVMNKKQSSLIESLLEEKTKNDQNLSHIVDEAFKLGLLFIKNLENVQGDEADILFIGTTYGPDPETKKVYQRFGPINGEHGWRRMNVLVTRAKKKIVLFTSMVSNDIEASEGNRGRMALKNYLHYVEYGNVDRQVDTVMEKDVDSPFEASIIRYIESLGFVAKPKIGVAGIFIDIGVMLEGENNYILGIECDGKAYYSSKSMRDRDRIRHEILKGMGWDIYRIWSADWFKNRKSEEERLRAKLTQKAVWGKGAKV